MNFDFSARDRAFIIAECGTCHAMPESDDRLLRAMQYVNAASNVGADSCKFQMFDDSELFCPYPGDEQRKPRWDASYMTLNDWRQVKQFAEACGMVFLGSVFQVSMVGWLNELKAEATKVASRAAKYFPYADAPQPFLISTGLPDYPKFINPSDPHAYYLECETNYPSTKMWTGPDTGFSDHSGTPWRAIDAISRGCKLIEVHFFIDPLDAGPDLPASLDLDQLMLICEARDAFYQMRQN